MKIRNIKYRNTFPKILVVLFTTLLVGCTCLPFSSPSSKTPITGAISYSDIVTYIEVNASGNPKWDGWIGITNQDQTLNYSITPSSPYVTINEDTGEITVLANALFSNNFTVTATGYGEFQDSVSTTLSVEVVPPLLYNVANIDDGDTLDIYGVHPLALAKVESSTYLFVGPQYNDELSIFSINGDGSPAYVGGVNNKNFLDMFFSFHTTKIGETSLFMAGGMGSKEFSVFSIGSEGSLNRITNVGDDRDLKLGGVASLTTALVGETNYLFVAGFSEHKVSMFSVDENINLSNVTNISDTNNMNLGGAFSVTTAQVGGVTYLFVAGWGDDGVSVFSVGNDGTLKNVDNVKDDDTLELDGVTSLTTANVGGNTYLFATGEFDDGLSVFSIKNDGTLVNVTNVSDNTNELKLKGARTVTTAVVDETTYLFVVGEFDNGVSMFSVGNDGSLYNLYNVSDNDILNLDGAWELATAVVDGNSYLFASGAVDDGVSIFLITH